MKSGHLCRYDGHLGKLTRLARTVRTLLKVRREAKRPLLVGTVILVFLSIFTKSQASSPFFFFFSEVKTPLYYSCCTHNAGGQLRTC